MIHVQVLLALLPLAARAEAQAPDRAALEQRLAAAESTKDWASALVAARDLDALAEAEHAETLYRVARLHALLGHHDEALEALERRSTTSRTAPPTPGSCAPASPRAAAWW